MLKIILTVTTILMHQSYAVEPKSLDAEIVSAKEKNIKGSVIFESVPEGLRVKAHVTGLEPNSRHGFHVHQNGECAGPDYKSAGDHFNPTKMKHGAHDSHASHAGDLGNLVANEEGEAHMDQILDKKNLMEYKGKAVLIHAKADDLKSQPAGNSGDRIACGIIDAI